MGLELVKRLIIESKICILTQTVVKNFTSNTAYIPFFKCQKIIMKRVATTGLYLIPKYMFRMFRSMDVFLPLIILSLKNQLWKPFE